MTCIFLIGADNLRYKQLNVYLNSNYIIGMYGYHQDILVVVKLLNNYIA